MQILRRENEYRKGISTGNKLFYRFNGQLNTSEGDEYTASIDVGRTHSFIALTNLCSRNSIDFNDKTWTRFVTIDHHGIDIIWPDALNGLKAHGNAKPVTIINIWLSRCDLESKCTFYCKIVHRMSVGNSISMQILYKIQEKIDLFELNS